MGCHLSSKLGKWGTQSWRKQPEFTRKVYDRAGSQCCLSPQKNSFKEKFPKLIALYPSMTGLGSWPRLPCPGQWGHIQTPMLSSQNSRALEGMLQLKADPKRPSHSQGLSQQACHNTAGDEWQLLLKGIASVKMQIAKYSVTLLLLPYIASCLWTTSSLSGDTGSHTENFFPQKASTEYVFICFAKRCVWCTESTQYRGQATAQSKETETVRK